MARRYEKYAKSCKIKGGNHFSSKDILTHSLEAGLNDISKVF